jgi:hypothetical protein
VKPVEHRTAAVLELWQSAGGQPLTVPLEGNSMAPLARSGDRVTIEPANPEQLRRGDIVALLGDGGLVVHRFLRSRSTPDGLSLCQQGDNSTARSWVAGESLVGRVIRIESPGRRLHLTAPPWTRLNPLLGRLPGRRSRQLLLALALRRRSS